MRVRINIFMFLVLILVFATSCKRVVVKLNSMPENTPIDQPIFVTGNFNNWDPNEDKYIMTLNADGNYYADLPSAFGTIEYKFTRGDWTTVEKGLCGEEIANRIFSISEIDTIANSIASWNDLDPIDCPSLTILLNLLPPNTPNDAIIALASSFNSWDPDNASVFNKTQSGDLYVTINRPTGIDYLNCKVTRGDLSTSESDEFGYELASRVLEFGKKDTIKLDVQGWIDLPITQTKDVVIIIKDLPENTPEYDDLYLACDLNSWITDDMNYEFQINEKGQHYYSIPRKNMVLNYKVTRGDWDTEEVDENGWLIDNRSIDLQRGDTVYIDILRWKDIGVNGDNEITIIINKLPNLTPNNAKIYITGTFNGWNPGKLRNKFQQDNYGNYYINLPRKDGDFEMKVTRGSWRSIQIDKYGMDTPNYKFSYNEVDTLFIDVENWRDLPKRKMQYVSMVIDKLPDNTPEIDDIYLASNQNNWDPEDENLFFDKLDDGRHIITFDVSGKDIEYKITRGGWLKVEVDKNGDEISDRKLYFGFSDTVFIQVDKWRDLDGNY